MSNLTHLQSVLEEARSHYLFSGFQLFCEKNAKPFQLSGGVTSYWPGADAVDHETFFDLGSLTKVICTTSVIARLVDGGTLQLEASVDRYVPALRATRLGALSIQNILSHSSGLIGWTPYFRDGDDLVRWLIAHESSLFVEGGRRPPFTCYSDIGFWILGLVLQSFGKSITQIYEDEVSKKLGVSCRYGSIAKNVAATEFCLWRNRLLVGEVFDENCAAQGGVGTHAGLFGSAEGVSVLAREWLRALRGESSWLRSDTATRFTSRAGHVSGSDWALGWDMRAQKNSSAGEGFSRNSFGHLGFPGCSVWIDPDVGGFAVFLTNRIHPSRHDERIRVLRPLIHDQIALIWKAL